MSQDKKGTVLVIDDEPAGLGMLFDHLQQANFKVLVAENGASALYVVERLQPDIILLDVNLPDMDGFDLCRRFKEIGTVQDTPIIFLTVATEPEDKVQGLAMNAVDYITKPFEPREVIVRVEKHTAIHKLQRQLKEKNVQLEEEIVERKRTGEILRESETRFRQLFNNMSNGVAVYKARDNGHDFVFVDFNRAGEKIEGAKRENLVGESVLVKFPGIKDFGLFEIFQRVWKTGEPEHHPASLYRDDRIIGWRENYVYKLPSGELVAVYNDVTERVQAEDELKMQARILESMVEGVNVSDQKSTIIFTNPAFDKMFGYERGELIGRHVSTLDADSPETSKRNLEEITEQVKAQGVWTGEFNNVRKDGSLFTTEARISALEISGKPHWVAVQEDISDRKEAECEREQLLAAEHEQRLLAEILRQVTLSLAAHTSHEAVLNEILRQVQRLVACTTANIILLEADNTMRVACWQGYDVFGSEEFISRIILPLESIPLYLDVVCLQKPLVIQDTRQEPRWVTFNQTAWVRSHLAVPISHHNDILGLLLLDGDSPGEFSTEDAKRLQPLAGAAAIALINARLYEQALKNAESRAVLLKEVNHRVKNNLSAIIGLLYTAQGHAKVADETAYQAMMNDMITRIEALSTVHNLLSAAEWLPLPLDDLITQIIAVAIQTVPPEKYITVKVSPSPVLVSPKQANHVAIVVNELTTNTIKYAIEERPQAAINVYIDQGDDRISFRFEDDGPGYPPETLRLERYGVGLDLMQMLVGRDLAGELSLQNNHGAITCISFPAG